MDERDVDLAVDLKTKTTFQDLYNLGCSRSQLKETSGSLIVDRCCVRSDAVPKTSPWLCCMCAFISFVAGKPHDHVSLRFTSKAELLIMDSRPFHFLK